MLVKCFASAFFGTHAREHPRLAGVRLGDRDRALDVGLRPRDGRRRAPARLPGASCPARPSATGTRPRTRRTSTTSTRSTADVVSLDEVIAYLADGCRAGSHPARPQEGASQCSFVTAADSWQLVRQPDHADLSGQLAVGVGRGRRRGAGRRGSRWCSRRRATTTAGASATAARPGIPSASARRAFLDVPFPAHLAFYRACIAGRDGRGPVRRAARLDARGRDLQRRATARSRASASAAQAEHQELVDEFVGEQEETLQLASRQTSASPRTSAGRTTSSCRSSTGSRSTSASRTGGRGRPTRSGSPRCRRLWGERRELSSWSPPAPWRVRIEAVPVRARARPGSRSCASVLPKRGYADQRRAPPRTSTSSRRRPSRSRSTRRKPSTARKGAPVELPEGHDDRGQRRQPLAPDHRRGRAGGADPRRRLRPLQPRSRDAR